MSDIGGVVKGAQVQAKREAIIELIAEMRADPSGNVGQRGVRLYGASVLESYIGLNDRPTVDVGRSRLA